MTVSQYIYYVLNFLSQKKPLYIFLKRYIRMSPSGYSVTVLLKLDMNTVKTQQYSKKLYFNFTSSWVAIFLTRLKSVSMWLRQNRRTFPHTSAGKHGLGIPWNTRAIHRPVSWCSDEYNCIKALMSPLTKPPLLQFTC